MQSIQLLALVTRPLDPALPVLLRLMGTTMEFLTIDPDQPSDPADHDSWQALDRCTPEDLEELREVVVALGGDPAAVLAPFPNCTDY